MVTGLVAPARRALAPAGTGSGTAGACEAPSRSSTDARRRRSGAVELLDN